MFVALSLHHADGLADAPIAAAFFACMALRVLGAWLTRSDAGPWQLRFWLIVLGCLGPSMVWGIRSVAVQLHAGAGVESVVMAILLCGVATGGVTALAPNRILQCVSMLLLFVPTIVVGFTIRELTSLAVLHTFFFGYVTALGGAAHRKYWEAVRSTELLRRHAASAEEAAREASKINLQLRAEIAQRAKMEVELRQAHKLEAIGRLAAGIAHEINTPAQFVSDSCRFIGDGVEQLTHALDAYERLVTDDDRVRIADEHDLGYLRDNLPTAIQRALDGLARVSAIVAATKAFAYPHRGEKALVDLNKSIQDTLVICNNETKFVADVRVELGALPPILCHPGELSQAVLNLVVNAAHAIEEARPTPDHRGTIRIRTWTEPGWVRISIADTGTGIPAAILDKIYEPFFTTKEVGRGSGQGLAIVRAAIVEKHDGTIDVASEPGRGTTFTLGLPIAS